MMMMREDDDDGYLCFCLSNIIHTLSLSYSLASSREMENEER